jgi:uncharacterized protein
MHTMPMKQKRTARAAYKAPVLKVAKKYGASRVKIFGSYARNTQTKKSDIDILVHLPKKSTLLDISGMKQDLEKVLKRKVDLVTYKGIKPSLRSRILREAKSL